MILALAVSPDGERLATAIEDRTIASSSNLIQVWNVEGELEQTLIGDEKTCVAVSFSPVQALMAVGSMEGIVSLISYPLTLEELMQNR
jgi:WD40 repeat protein